MAKYKRTYPPYWIAKLIAKDSGSKSRAKYRDWYQENSITHVPFDPIKVYKDDWEGWGEFLGTGNVFESKKGNFHEYLVPFWEGVRWAQSLKLGSREEWFEYCKNNELPVGIPDHPEHWYKDKWTGSGWTAWLGLNVEQKIESAKHTQESTLWAFMWTGHASEPSNVITLSKVGGKNEVRERVQTGWHLMGLYKYEPEYNEQMWKVIEKYSTEWYGQKNKRLCSSWNELKFELNSVLMRVKY